MIEVKNLSKSYGLRTAIKELNFSVKKGEVIGFLGPNGAGKTTTMKIITGFMSASEGAVIVDGLDVFEHPIEVKRKIGYLPEIPPVYGDMKVREYLEFVAALRGVPRSEVKSQAVKAIGQTRLEGVQGRFIQNLSKGFRQRVGLAQALVTEPEILILDEPTVGLDPKQVAEIRELILKLKGHHTVILSTHILPEVQASCERVIIINEGQIVAEDSLEGLSQRMSGQSRIIVKVKRSQLLHSLETVEGVQKVSRTKDSFLIDVEKGDRGDKGDGDDRGDGDDKENNKVEAIAQYVIQSGAGLMEIRSDDMNLENIFIKLTSSEAETMPADRVKPEGQQNTQRGEAETMPSEAETTETKTTEAETMPVDRVKPEGQQNTQRGEAKPEGGTAPDQTVVQDTQTEGEGV